MTTYKLEVSQALFTGITRNTHIKEKIISYNGIYFTMTISSAPIQQGQLEFGIYLYPINESERDGHLKCKIGILNANGTLCRQTPLEHAFNPSEVTGRGRIFHTSTLAKLVTDYGQHNGTDVMLIFACKIESYDQKISTDRMIREIYKHTDARITAALLSQIDVLHGNVRDLELQVAKLTSAAEASSASAAASSASGTVSSSASLTIASVEEYISSLTHADLIRLQKVLQQAILQATLCSICSDKEIDTSLVPCGHGCCKSCAEKLQHCHMCRANITMRLHRY